MGALQVGQVGLSLKGARVAVVELQKSGRMAGSGSSELYRKFCGSAHVRNRNSSGRTNSSTGFLKLPAVIRSLN